MTPTSAGLLHHANVKSYQSQRRSRRTCTLFSFSSVCHCSASSPSRLLPLVSAASGQPSLASLDAGEGSSLPYMTSGLAATRTVVRCDCKTIYMISVKLSNMLLGTCKVVTASPQCVFLQHDHFRDKGLSFGCSTYSRASS